MEISRVVPLAAGLLLNASQTVFVRDSSTTMIVNIRPNIGFDAGDAWDLKV